jgi:hypothetical protein
MLAKQLGLPPLRQNPFLNHSSACTNKRKELSPPKNMGSFFPPFPFMQILTPWDHMCMITLGIVLVPIRAAVVVAALLTLAAVPWCGRRATRRFNPWFMRMWVG